MKIIKVLSIILIISIQIALNNSKRRDGTPVAEGGVCYKAIPSFAGKKLPCADGLTCKKKSEGLGGAYTCQKSRRLREEELEEDAPVAEGGVCYKAIPSFAGKKLPCADGLTCKKKSEGQGGAYTCQKSS